MKKEKCIILILLVIIVILIGGNINFILEKNAIVKSNKQIIKEMNESTQVTDLNNQINALNTEHTEYMNYIQTCKTQIATALTAEGVETFENDTFEKMVANIGDIFTQRTKLDESVAATADNISKGKQAYVNGELITGILSRTLHDFSSSSSKVILKDSFYPTSKGTISRNFNATKGKIYLFVGLNRAGTWEFSFSSNFHAIYTMDYWGVANSHYVAVGYVDSDSTITVSATATTTNTTSTFHVAEITFE